MKKIKIFIASSAELNEDKQMFDLYFSDKNKLYRDRNIDFDQRTWMDFSSSLNEEKNHRLKSMVLVPGWSRGHPGLYFSSSCEFPRCSCWACLSGQRPSICCRRPRCRLKAPLGLSLLRKRGPTPNPAGNVYGKREFSNAKENI